MRLNKTGMFVCANCLERDCKVEKDLFDRELQVSESLTLDSKL